MKNSIGLFLIAFFLASCGGGGFENANVINPPPVVAQNPTLGTILYAFCPSPFQNGGTVWILGVGSAPNCSSGWSTAPMAGVPITTSGKLTVFRLLASTSVALTGTVYINGSATNLSCTVASGNGGCRITGSVSVFDTDEVSIGVTPTGSGSFSNVRVSVEKQ